MFKRSHTTSRAKGEGGGVVSERVTGGGPKSLKIA